MHAYMHHRAVGEINLPISGGQYGNSKRRELSEAEMDMMKSKINVVQYLKIFCFLLLSQCKFMLVVAHDDVLCNV